MLGLVRRLNEEEIFIPKFQRGFVWKEKEASKFVESLLLALPVPGIFTAIDPETKKMYVIDGQQRLRTLQFFVNGIFNPHPEDKKQKVFSLVEVQERFEERTYAKLEEQDRRRFNNSIIHTTVVKQESPKDGDTSIYHIFERLNTGGQKLNQQEIRIAAYYGPIFELLKRLNDEARWRKIFGKQSARLKDQELILRFLALYFGADQYEKPFSEFLTKFALRHRFPSPKFVEEAEKIFLATIEAATLIGENAFRPERVLNAAVFDSVMVGIAARVKKGPIKDQKGLRDAYASLVKNGLSPK